jgi:tetratricopeptide (TPR) repeat protein
VAFVDQFPPRTLLEYLVRISRRTIDENCAAFEHTAAAHGENATLSTRQLWRWMTGETAHARPVAQRVAELHWGHRFEALIGPPPPPGRLALRQAGTLSADDGPATAVSGIDQVERLRQGVHDAVSTGALAAAGLDEWDETVARHGLATRYRPAALLLGELAADFAELQRVLARRHTASALRRLTRTTAQMAGLMFLTLIKLDVPLAARNWARTARVAADEAGDPAIRSWVRAQEAYVHYYAGNLAEALTVARHAQHLAGTINCVGVPLAAALEARALGILGHRHDTHAALDRAETAVSRLSPGDLMPSAFSYNEAQLRFHEGNAFTHLHDTQAAWTAQDRALELYPATDFFDRTLIDLDRASCLAHDGDATTAMRHATRVLVSLPGEQRQGLILLRGRQVLTSLGDDAQALPAGRDLQDVLTVSAHERTDRP